MTNANPVASAGAGYLALSGLTTQLFDHFHNLEDAGRSDRMALALQAARGVDGQRPAQGGLALLQGAVAFTLGEESDFLALGDFEDCESVVQFGDIDVLGAEPGHLVGIVGRLAHCQQISWLFAFEHRMGVGGLPDAVEDGKTGRLIKPNEIDALVDVINKVTRSDAATMIPAIQAMKRNLTWASLAATLLDGR